MESVSSPPTNEVTVDTLLALNIVQITPSLLISWAVKHMRSEDYYKYDGSKMSATPDPKCRQRSSSYCKQQLIVNMMCVAKIKIRNRKTMLKKKIFLWRNG